MSDAMTNIKRLDQLEIILNIRTGQYFGFNSKKIFYGYLQLFKSFFFRLCSCFNELQTSAALVPLNKVNCGIQPALSYSSISICHCQFFIFRISFHFASFHLLLFILPPTSLAWVYIPIYLTSIQFIL